MDEATLVGYINKISGYGDEDLTKRFTQLMKSFYNDSKITSMPEENQEALFSKLYDRYSQTAETQGLTAPESTLDKTLNSVPSSGDGGGPEVSKYTGTSESSERVMDSLGASLKDGVTSSLSGAGIGALISGAPIGESIIGALSGASLTTMGVGAVGDAITTGMGFGVGSGFMDKIGSAGFSMALGMVNPVLGLAASVLGKPLADLVSDATGLRDLDTMRDNLEDQLGEIGGRQAYADAYNSLQTAYGDDVYEGMSEEQQEASDFESVRNIAGARLEQAMAREVPNVDEIQKLQNTISATDKLIGLTPTDTWDNATASAKAKTQRNQELQVSGILGITTDELADRKRLAEKYGLSAITGTEVLDAKTQEAAEAKAEADAVAKAQADAKAKLSWGNSSGSGGNTSQGGYGGVSGQRSDGSSSGYGDDSDSSGSMMA